MTEREVEELILLKRKVERLLEGYKQSEESLLSLKMENEQLKDELKAKEKKLVKLEKKYNDLQLSGAIKGDDESTRVAKKRINKLVREIDNCIALLNNI